MARNLILLLILFFFKNSYTKPPLETLLDCNFTCSEDINEPLVTFNPLCGALAAEGYTLKNMWMYGNPLSAMVQLLKTLFVVEEDEELLTTTYDPYYTFTPETIAHFVSRIYNKNLDTKDEGGKYISIPSITKTFKGPNSPKRMHILIDLIASAQEEEAQGLYPAGTLYGLFLAFLYLQAEELVDLHSYTKHLSSLLTHSDENNTLPVTKISSHHIHKIIDKYKLPYRVPKANWARKIAYKNYKPISDCCETAIRGFINELLYDSNTKTCMISRLRTSLQAKVPESVKNFYNNYQKSDLVDDINNKMIHHEWLDLISNLPELEYRKQHYEIEPRLSNIMYAIGLLCGIKNHPNKYLCINHYIHKLCKKLSNPALFTLQRLKTIYGREKPTIDVIFLLKHTTMQLPYNYFTLHVRTNHAWITQAANHNLEGLSLPSLYNLATTTHHEKCTALKRLQKEYDLHHELPALIFMHKLLKKITYIPSLRQALLYLIHSKAYFYPLIKETILKKYRNLPITEQAAIMMAFVSHQLYEDSDFFYPIALTLRMLPDYEYHPYIIIDRKIWTLQRLKLLGADAHSGMKRIIDEVEQTLSDNRLIRYRQGLLYATELLNRSLKG